VQTTTTPGNSTTDGNGGSTATFDGFVWKGVQVDTIQCPENRFGNDTVGKGMNLTSSYCPQEVKLYFGRVCCYN